MSHVSFINVPWESPSSSLENVRVKMVLTCESSNYEASHRMRNAVLLRTEFKPREIVRELSLVLDT